MFFGRWVGFRAAWPSAVVEKVGIATAMMFFEAPPAGYDVLWSEDVGAAIVPVASR